MIVTSARSPRAKHSSASRRSRGHAYDPGCRRAGARPSLPTIARCASSALDRARVRHPFERHERSSVTTKSRPAFARRNAAEWCPSQSHIRTPWVSSRSNVVPRVRSRQIAQTGDFTGTSRALYKEGKRVMPARLTGRDARDCAEMMRVSANRPNDTRCGCHLALPHELPRTRGSCALRPPQRPSDTIRKARKKKETPSGEDGASTCGDEPAAGLSTGSGRAAPQR